LAKLGSAESVRTEAVFRSVLLPTGALPETFTVMLKETLPLRAMLPRLHVSVPVGACTQLSVLLEYDVWASNKSVTTTLVAVAAPMLLTVMV
jgi:hypothetical protein